MLLTLFLPIMSNAAITFLSGYVFHSLGSFYQGVESLSCMLILCF